MFVSILYILVFVDALLALLFVLSSCMCLSGNDLARVLRWGAGYSGEEPYNILLSVDEAEVVQIDRWTILLDAVEMTEDDQENGFLEPPKVIISIDIIYINMV